MTNHRGRHQAQGEDIPGGDSRNWNEDSPYPATTGHHDLSDLEAGLSDRQKRARTQCFGLAHRFITNAQTYGGVGPTSRSFPAGRPGEDTDIRVDIEVKKGRAFV